MLFRHRSVMVRRVLIDLCPNGANTQPWRTELAFNRPLQRPPFAIIGGVFVQDTE